MRRPLGVVVSSEDLAYWFLRLNGCLTIRNFLLHPPRRGGLRTDADIVGVRFPHRREYDMIDHPLFEGSRRLEFVVAEVKANQSCSLNGPWTQPQRKNINHLLESIGPLPPGDSSKAAERLYATGTYENEWFRGRLFTFGIAESEALRRTYPKVPQLTWADVLEFLHHRFRNHKNQKKDHHQWDAAGQLLCESAVELPLNEYRAMFRL